MALSNKNNKDGNETYEGVYGGGGKKSVEKQWPCKGLLKGKRRKEN
jgi:hypothetical protein